MENRGVLAATRIQNLISDDRVASWLQELKNSVLLKGHQVSCADDLTFRIYCLEIEANHNKENICIRYRQPSAFEAVTIGRSRQSIRNYQSFYVRAPRINQFLQSEYSNGIPWSSVQLPDQDESLSELFMTQNQFLFHALSSRNTSHKLQQIIAESSVDTFEKFVDLAIMNFKLLAFHKYSCYVLLLLIEKSQTFGLWMLNLNPDVVAIVCMREFGSKVFQAFAMYSLQYCCRALEVVKLRTKAFVSTASGAFFVCVCIKQAKIFRIDMEWLFDFLLSDCAKVLTSKYRKRILLTFLEHSNQKYQDQAFDSIIGVLPFPRIIRDKNLAMILSCLITCGCYPAEALAVVALQEDGSLLTKPVFVEAFLKRLQLRKDSALLKWAIQKLRLVFHKFQYNIPDENSKLILVSLYRMCSNSQSFESNTDLYQLCTSVQQKIGVRLASPREHSDD